MYEEAYKHCKSKGAEKAKQAAAAVKSRMEREACLRLLNAGEFPCKQKPDKDDQIAESSKMRCRTPTREVNKREKMRRRVQKPGLHDIRGTCHKRVECCDGKVTRNESKTT